MNSFRLKTYKEKYTLKQLKAIVNQNRDEEEQEYTVSSLLETNINVLFKCAFETDVIKNDENG